VVGFGFKIALVPFHMWAPDVYEGAPTSVTAFMSVGAKAAGFAALGRVVFYAFGDWYLGWGWVLALLAALTMTAGNLAALRQTNLKRMLAYSSIAHAGYILVGLAAGSELGLSAVLFYLFAYAFTNVGAFAVIIAVSRFNGGGPEGETLVGFAGLWSRRPGLAAAMAVLMFSLAGVPPLVGFVAKLYVFTAAVQAGLIWLAILGVVNSVVSAYYYLRVVAVMVVKKAAGAEPERAPICPALQVGLGLVTVVLGLWPGLLLELARAGVALLAGG